MIGTRLEAICGEPADQDCWTRAGMATSLLACSLAFLVWCTSAAVFGSALLAFRRRGRDLAAESWPSGDEL